VPRFALCFAAGPSRRVLRHPADLDAAEVFSDFLDMAEHRTKAHEQQASVVVRRQVDLWSATRYLADHGMFTNVKPPTLREMYAGVLRFLGEQFG
jgi:hypothetical protein